jgi:prepilin-type N-terminal cleavage/methylation domain-containing protein
MKGKQEKGFTMIELVVVIALMGVLMAILVPSFIGTLQNMKVNSDIRSIQTIHKQAEMYQLQNGQYPGVTVVSGSSEKKWSESNFVNDLKKTNFLDETSIRDDKIVLQSDAVLCFKEGILQLEAKSDDTLTKGILEGLAEKVENQKWINLE